MAQEGFAVGRDSRASFVSHAEAFADISEDAVVP